MKNIVSTPTDEFAMVPNSTSSINFEKFKVSPKIKDKFIVVYW